MPKLGFHPGIWYRRIHPAGFRRALDDLSLLGYDGFETSGSEVEQYLGPAEEFKKLLAMHDLEVSTLYSPHGYINAATIEDEIASAHRTTDYLAALGCGTLLLDGGTKRPEGNSEADYRAVAEAANRIGKYARERGVPVSWHQHYGTMFDVPEAFDRLMELTDPELVGFCPDMAQLLMSGFDITGTVRKYVHRINFVHFKDVDYNHRFGQLHGGPKEPADTSYVNIDSKWRVVELGRGLIDFPALWGILKEAGYDGYIVVDQDYTAYQPWDCAATTKRYLNEALGIYGQRDLKARK